MEQHVEEGSKHWGMLSCRTLLAGPFRQDSMIESLYPTGPSCSHEAFATRLIAQPGGFGGPRGDTSIFPR